MKKSNLDERQEQKLLQIEHNGCWLAYWGLLAVILIQAALDGGSLESVTGELAVFFALCAYISLACMKNGIWDRKLKPTPKTNLLLSLIPGVVLGLFWFGVSYHNYHNLVGSIATGAFIFLFITPLVYATMAITAKLYKKRVKKLEDEAEEEG